MPSPFASSGFLLMIPCGLHSAVVLDAEGRPNNNRRGELSCFDEFQYRLRSQRLVRDASLYPRWGHKSHPVPRRDLLESAVVNVTAEESSGYLPSTFATI